ncbi:MAG: hypothetical protein DRP87_01670 [Spirochaetes bacterium]|nr:MAG: hypothetical protein DRP87_01670 [Spirochaetota bacterium]
MILIDSDIIIWLLRGEAIYKNKFSIAVERFKAQVFITPIQYVEIIAGVKEKIDTEIFLDSLRIINIDKEVGKLAGEFMRLYRKSHNVHGADSIVAAVAKIHNCKLWTNNKKHFPMLAEEEFYTA